MKNFAERIADYAVANGFEISEAGFEKAMNAYMEDWKATLSKLQKNGGQMVKLQFANALNKSLI